MLVESEPARKVMASIARIAPYKTAVLVHGESGVGKELISRAIHRQGPCPNGPFVTFNCSNLVESLAESQLFGHVKGAFTDAREESLGYFRSANGGTLFLDEVGELPLKLQPKLLRAVETHEVQAVGSAHTYKVDIRLVCATNRDLKAMVKDGSFRADLYYRLNAAAITVPPLRERREGIPALVAHFVEHHGRAFGKNIRFISREALETLCACEWPGNVRQLSHAIESALMMTDSDRIALDDLPETIARNDVCLRRPIPPRRQPEAARYSRPVRDLGFGRDAVAGFRDRARLARCTDPGAARDRRQLRTRGGTAGGLSLHRVSNDQSLRRDALQGTQHSSRRRLVHRANVPPMVSRGE